MSIKSEFRMKVLSSLQDQSQSVSSFGPEWSNVYYLKYNHP